MTDQPVIDGDATEHATDTEFPVDTFRDAARHLRRPFMPAAVKFKVQATWPRENPTSGLIVGYIDARLVVERLNLVCPHLWRDAYEPTPKGLMWCHLTIDGITRSDVGEGVGKGLVSDALKRAAVRFGIGVSLYALPKMVLHTSDATLKQRRSRDGVTLELTPKGETVLRGMYEHWLDAHGTEAFGEPLDHGDVEGAAGDHQADGAPPMVEHEPAMVQEVASDVPAVAISPAVMLDLPEPEDGGIDPAFQQDILGLLKKKKPKAGEVVRLFNGVGLPVTFAHLKPETAALIPAYLSARQATDLVKAIGYLPDAKKTMTPPAEETGGGTVPFPLDGEDS